MSSTLRSVSRHWINIRSRRFIWLAAGGVLVLAFVLGQRASPLWLGLLVTGFFGVAVLARPALIPFALMAAALLSPVEISSGTEVRLNLVSLLVPVLAAIWLLNRLLLRNTRVVRTRANLPLLLFLAAGLLSLLIGRATWDPVVPLGGNFLVVQIAQWAIFAFSALAFWLAANLVTNQSSLWRLTAFGLLVLGSVTLLTLVPGVTRFMHRLPASALGRVLLLTLLAGIGGGQLLYNRQLSPPWRIFMVAALLATLVYAFAINRVQVAGWVTVAAALGVLVWLRFPRLRWPMTGLVAAVAIAGLLVPTIYQFAGGDSEWTLSGASRLVLIERVVNVTLRNPITGLGPAAYRPYTAMEPMRYLNANWLVPRINSHNNYVDIFAHTGVVGLALFLWFIAEVARLAWRLRQRFRSGFAAGYVNGTLAVLVATMVSMLLADVFLPFVYNVGFPGFQASVLVWLFMGGLVALENMERSDDETRVEGKGGIP